MNRLIDYIAAKQLENIELALKTYYTKRIGWTIEIHKKGYDMPIVYVRENDKEDAFDLAYSALKVKLEGHL